MNDFILAALLISIFLVFIWRIQLQKEGIKILKNNKEINTIGIDKFLLLFPEIFPTRYCRKELGEKISDELSNYFSKLKHYRYFCLIVISLFVIELIIKIR